MLMRYLVLCLSALFFVSCQLHVAVKGLQEELVLIENETGEKLVLTDNELVSFDHDFSAFSAYNVSIFKESGQKCHVVYKSGRFSTPYTELEVNCQPIVSAESCNDEGPRVCVRIENDITCEGCLPQIYKTYPNLCQANTSGLNPIFIGLEECPLLDDSVESSNDAPAVFIDTAVVKDQKITVNSATFSEDIVTIEIEHNGACGSDDYILEINKFELNDTSLDWALQYSRNHCATLETKAISFDLKPIRDWYFQVNGLQTGSIDLPGIGTYRF
ncbi:hypothetical protein [Marinicellulosiphila megalodicopiae]|uniref:hypothetical protein n=1 Tax=Marinicellulosiphila megalodicopiae TaxID=2724896 RepID=UPI003BB0F3AF